MIWCAILIILAFVGWGFYEGISLQNKNTKLQEKYYKMKLQRNEILFKYRGWLDNGGEIDYEADSYNGCI